MEHHPALSANFYMTRVRDAKMSFHGPHYVLLTMNISSMVYYIFDKLLLPGQKFG